MNFKPNTSYTIEELKEIAGDSYMMFLSSPPIIPIPSPNKEIIYSFDNFDSNTKQIYNSLFLVISSLNPTSNFNVFAVGERVNGTWRSKQEVDQINNDLGVQLIESPYSYTSNAKNLPASSGLPFNVQLDQTNSTHMVIIPPPNE
jgi:hypothetical protein